MHSHRGMRVLNRTSGKGQRLRLKRSVVKAPDGFNFRAISSANTLNSDRASRSHGRGDTPLDGRNPRIPASESPRHRIRQPSVSHSSVARAGAITTAPSPRVEARQIGAATDVMSPLVHMLCIPSAASDWQRGARLFVSSAPWDHHTHIFASDCSEPSRRPPE